MAARRSRERRLQYVQELETRLTQYRQETIALKMRLQQMTEEVYHLRSMLAATPAVSVVEGANQSNMLYEQSSMDFGTELPAVPEEEEWMMSLQDPASQPSTDSPNEMN